MELRREFVALAGPGGPGMSELCRRFGISRQTGYKWLGRWRAGDGELADRSRRPHASPAQTPADVEAAVLAVRDRHPAWGARKIVRVLARDGLAPPAASTVHAILARHGRIVAPQGGARASTRFERPAPNELWQMDFKGRFRLGDGSWCHALTVIDDHSRYALCLEACADETAATVRARLATVFRRHGLPGAIFVDNGSPWGPSSRELRWTRLSVWLARLGVAVLHSRPYHPQSRGKVERFHRSIDDEVLACRPLADLAAARRAFARWRTIYNTERPHQALDQNVPASRYRPSPRTMPRTLPAIVYDDRDIVRTVPETKDYISFRGRKWKLPQAFRGERVAIRPTAIDGRYTVCFAAHVIATIDVATNTEHTHQTVSDLPERVSTISPG